MLSSTRAETKATCIAGLLLTVLLSGPALADTVVKTDQQRIECRVDSVDSWFVWATMPNRAVMSFALADVSALEVGDLTRREALKRALSHTKVKVVPSTSAQDTAHVVLPPARGSNPLVPADTVKAVRQPATPGPLADTSRLTRPPAGIVSPVETTAASSSKPIPRVSPESTLEPEPQPAGSLNSEVRGHLLIAGRRLKDAERLTFTADGLLALGAVFGVIGIAAPALEVVAVACGIGALVSATMGWVKFGDAGNSLQQAADAGAEGNW